MSFSFQRQGAHSATSITVTTFTLVAERKLWCFVDEGGNIWLSTAMGSVIQYSAFTSVCMRNVIGRLLYICLMAFSNSRRLSCFHKTLKVLLSALIDDRIQGTLMMTNMLQNESSFVNSEKSLALWQPFGSVHRLHIVILNAGVFRKRPSAKVR